MRLLQRNLQTIHYCLYKEQSALLDENGYESGESVLTYETAKELRCSVSSASGSAQVETFGSLESYDKVIITDDMSCPIDENTVLFIDKAPEYAADGQPIPDYIVKRVAKSLNAIAYAVSKVKVS